MTPETARARPGHAALDVEALRREFPIADRCVYLDNAGAAPNPRRTVEAVSRFLQEYSEGGIYRHWEHYESLVDGVRDALATLLGAGRDEVALVGSASEGINIIAHALPWQPGDRVVITDLEFPSNVYPWLHLSRLGVEIRVAAHEDGVVPAERIVELIDERTRLVSLSHVTFASGYRQDVARVAPACRSAGARLLVDATQSAGWLPLDVCALGADFVVCAGFKWLLSPHGTGALYCRRELLAETTPRYASWLSVREPFDFRRPRAAELAADARRFMLTPNLAISAFIGMLTSLRLLLEVGVERVHDHVMELGGLLRASARDLGLTTWADGPPETQSPIVNVRVPDARAMVEALRAQDVIAVERLGGVRLSPHLYNTAAEIRRAMEALDVRCSPRIGGAR